MKLPVQYRRLLFITILLLLTACGGKGSEPGTSNSSVKSTISSSSTAATSQLKPLNPDTKADPSLPTRDSVDWDKARDAARFLAQGSFGVTAKDIDFILVNGKEAWLEQQLSTTLTSQVAYLDERVKSWGFLPVPPHMYYNAETGGEWDRLIAKHDIWWETVIWGSDQLRQRVVLALSQILVVSHLGNGLYARERGFANYTDILAEHAFGNYADLLTAVSLNPIMGIYLSSINNPKADPARDIHPDENYAREVLQLFSIGLEQLNIDGSIKRDANGKSIPTFDQQTVNEFARVFTGWTFSTNTTFAEGGERAYFPPPIGNVEPMKAFAEFHDAGAKALLNGQVIPAGQTPRQDIDAAINNIMAHENIAPFICKKLIQHLITSNPGPAYIARVAAVFNNNGQGIKGDMKAVIKAIYLDQDANNIPAESADYFGKHKETPLVIAGIWRSFKARGTPVKGPNGTWANTIQYLTEDPIEQTFLYSPTVFNFYQTDYSPPGELAARNLLAPELQVFGGAAAVNQANLLANLIYRRHYNDKDLYTDTGQAWGGNSRWNKLPVKAVLNLDSEIALATTPTALVDRVNLLLTQGQISAEHSALIVEHISLLQDPLARAYETIFLIAISPEYAIQR